MTKKEISEILGIDQNTIKNWERSRPELHRIVMEHFESEKICPDINNPEYLKKEILKAVETLPNAKVRKFYHLMMAELVEMGH